MGKRSQPFLLSQKWRDRDVRVEHLADGNLRVTDLVSKISITGHIGQRESALLADLRHRVHQFE